MVRNDTAQHMLTIARIGLSIYSDVPLFYPPQAGPIEKFLSSPPAPADIDIPVYIKAAVHRDFGSMKVLAEAEDAWKLLQDNSCSWLASCFQHPDGKPAWAAKLNPNTTEITIECGLTAGNDKIPSPLLYPLDQLILINTLADNQGILIHGAGIKKGDDAIVLAGKSGAGKTTSADLINNNSEYEILSDDRIIIRNHNGTLKAHGTPWPGDGGFAINDSAKLKGICFLKQDKENELSPINIKGALERLIPVSSIPWHDQSLTDKTLCFLETLAGKTKGFDFLFRKDPSMLSLIEKLFNR